MQKRIVTVQDVSCVGQCSLTVALPIISAYGVETCILPSSVLSNHTGGFTGGYTFCDLTDEIPAILDTWQKNRIVFDALYTGYIGDKRQFALINRLRAGMLRDGAPVIIDPAMADNGRLYAGFDLSFARAMGDFASTADYLLPNITEAALILDMPYREQYDEDYILAILQGLCARGARTAVLTGVSYEPDRLGVAVYSKGDPKPAYHFEERVPVAIHGTGDVFASSFTGDLLRGATPLEAAAEAARFTRDAILNTLDTPEHFYGVNFEGVLHTVRPHA